MVDKLPTLPIDFETRIRDGLIAIGFKLTTRGRAKVSEWTPAGGRDSAMVSNAGILARAVIRGERSLLEAMHEMEVWCGTYVENVVGDPIDMAKGKAKIMEFIERDMVKRGKTLPLLWSKGMSPEEVKKAKEFFGEENEAQTCQEILMDLQEQFSSVSREDTASRTAVIESSLRKVVRSPDLTEIDHDVIISFIMNACGRMTTANSLRKRIRALAIQNEPTVGEDHSEISRALKDELELTGEIRFHNTKFYQWRGSHWVQMGEQEIEKTISREFGHLPAARKFNDIRGIRGVLAMISAAPLGDERINGINFANGFLTPDLELLDHDPNLGCTYVLPYRYIQNDRAPSMWFSLLDQCWGHEPDFEDRVQALREAIAATLFGIAYRYSRAFCLYGVAHSGKSTILNIIQGLIPADASSSVPPHDWADKFLPTRMEGKLINFCGELSESQLINGASFKTIVEGTAISGQYKGRDIFEFTPKCAQWFGGNHIPRSRDSSDGFARRWLFLTFNKPVSMDQKRTDLVEEILSEEREAIVAWAAPSIRDLMRRSDFKLPESHNVMTLEVLNQNNSARQFIRSGGVVFEKGAAVEEGILFNYYYTYCKVTAHIEPVSRFRFRLFMKALQSHFDFKVVEGRSKDGTEACMYQGMAVAQRKKAA